jgi:hypothetical protein
MKLEFKRAFVSAALRVNIWVKALVDLQQLQLTT